jgi:hypothetical protein
MVAMAALTPSNSAVNGPYVAAVPDTSGVVGLGDALNDGTLVVVDGAGTAAWSTG